MIEGTPEGRIVLDGNVLGDLADDCPIHDRRDCSHEVSEFGLRVLGGAFGPNPGGDVMGDHHVALGFEGITVTPAGTKIVPRFVMTPATGP